MIRRALFSLLVFASLLGASQGCSGSGGLFAPPTQTPTSTFTPTGTATPLPTHTATLTPIPTATATSTLTPQPSGVFLDPRSDGAHFIDYDGAYRLILPAGWAAINLSQADFDAILTQAGEAQPELEAMVAALEGLDASIFRIYTLDTDPDHIRSGYITNLNVVLDRNPLASGLPLETLLAANMQSLGKTLPGAEIISGEVSATPSGLPIGLIELNWSLQQPSGVNVQLYQQMVFFKVEAGAVYLALTTLDELRETTVRQFDRTVESIELLSP